MAEETTGGLNFSMVFSCDDKTCSLSEDTFHSHDSLKEGDFAWMDFAIPNGGALRKALLGMGLPEKEALRMAEMGQETYFGLHQDRIVILVHLARSGGGVTPLLIAMTDRMIVTARRDPLPLVRAVQEKSEESFRAVGKSPGFIFFLLWDGIIDHFMPHVASVDGTLEKIEDRYLHGDTSESILQEILTCKQRVRALKHCLMPMQRGTRRLVTLRLDLISKEAAGYLGGIFEHMDRVAQQIDSLQDRVHATLSGYSSTLSQRMNSSMKVLTIIATVMMPLSLIAGVYGTNFKDIPELAWEHGYYYFLGLLLVVAVIMLLGFKLKKWI